MAKQALSVCSESVGMVRACSTDPIDCAARVGGAGAVGQTDLCPLEPSPPMAARPVQRDGVRGARFGPRIAPDRISSASKCPARTTAFDPNERTREHHALSRSRDDRRSDSTLRQIQAVRPDVRPDRAHPIRRARTDLGWSSHVGRVPSRGQRARKGRRPPSAHAHRPRSRRGPQRSTLPIRDRQSSRQGLSVTVTTRSERRRCR